MNPEQAAIHNLDRRRRPDDIKDSVDTLLKNAGKVREILDNISFNPENFSDLYTEEGVAKDLRYVADMERMFRSRDSHEVIPGLTEGDIKRLSERVEYEVIRGINAGQWFEGVGAYKTSDYDDIANGVDVVLEMQEAGSYGHLGMGVDITFSHNIDKKFLRIKDEIDNFDGDKHRLARVKYFDSANTGIRGELHGIARAVIAIDLPMLKDMTNVRDDEMLHKHISKHITLLEIQNQLEIFLAYAKKSNPAAAKPIERASAFISTLVEKLKSEDRVNQSEYTKNRRADDAINRCLEMFSVEDSE
jgi:hypothetical protein